MTDYLAYYPALGQINCTNAASMLTLLKRKLKQQKIETPSWGYGDSGTRFKVFRGRARRGKCP